MKNLFRNFTVSALKSWDWFFFAPLSLLPLGVFRFLFGFNRLTMDSIRMMDWRFYFTDEGMVHHSWAIELLPEFFRPAIALLPTTPSAAFWMQVVLLLALFFLTIGLWGRWMALIALVLHLAFMQRNYSIVYGADIVTSFMLFALALTDNSRSFSLESWLRKKWRPMNSYNQILSTVGVRLVQIQLCIIYGYTGMEKLKGTSWWDGTAVWSVLGNQQLMMFDTSWMKHFPVVIAAMTFSTLIFEVYFPVLVWLKATRKWVLLFGWLLHVMIALTMGLFFFSGAMMAAYFVFVDPKWLRSVLERWLPEKLLVS